jgi:hypothetical protein
MCKEMPVIPDDRVVDPKRIIGKKWRAKEEERNKWLLTPKNATRGSFQNNFSSLQEKFRPG